MLSIGSLAPAISLPDSHDVTQTLASFVGHKVFVYFYPRASTPGCTQQGCALQTALSEGEISNVVVLGISPDKPAALAKFSQKYGFEFLMLSDVDHSVAEANGAWGQKKNYGKEYMGIVRSAVLIDEHGMVAKVWPAISPKTTVSELVTALGE